MASFLVSACDSVDGLSRDGSVALSCDGSPCCSALDLPALRTDGTLAGDARDILMLPDLGPGAWFGTWLGGSHVDGVTDLAIQTEDFGEIHFRLPSVGPPSLDVGEEVSVSLTRLASGVSERDDRLMISRSRTRQMMATYVTQSRAALPLADWESLSVPPLGVHNYPVCRGDDQGDCGYHPQTYDLIVFSGTFQVEVAQGESLVLDTGGLRYQVMNRQTIDNGIVSPTDACHASGTRSFDIVGIP